LKEKFRSFRENTLSGNRFEAPHGKIDKFEDVVPFHWLQIGKVTSLLPDWQNGFVACPAVPTTPALPKKAREKKRKEKNSVHGSPRQSDWRTCSRRNAVVYMLSFHMLMKL
jgi:hypothetical protein